ncbi:MAG: glycosyltransferase family 4 protein [Rhodocyclaceae bacterium]|nr:glycosyltransferase family 4 protein [Rhodocyclaceae bacterium]
MKVGFISYPMLFQRGGGLQIQIQQTQASLQNKGIDVSLINPITERLENYDLIHVFSAINGNYRIAEHLQAIGKPMVASPLLRPYWNRRLGRRAQLLEKAVYALSRWTVRTEYHQIETFLRNARILYSLSEAEKQALVEAFSIDPETIFSAPNGIEERFFHSDPQAFREHFGISSPYVLQVSTINSHKNPLATAKACRQLGYELVLIGPTAASDKAYLEEVTCLSNVHYLGPMRYDDPLLPSAYAGADVFCLPSLSEVSPLVTVESLATGTPVVMTKNHAMDFGVERQYVSEVNPHSLTEIATALGKQLTMKVDRKLCAKSVERLRWSETVNTIIDGYRHALEG